MKVREFSVIITVNETNTYEVRASGEDEEAAMDRVEKWAQAGGLSDHERISRVVDVIQVESVQEDREFSA